MVWVGEYPNSKNGPGQSCTTFYSKSLLEVRESKLTWRLPQCYLSAAVEFDRYRHMKDSPSGQAS